MKDKVKITEFIKVSELEPEDLRKRMCIQVGQKATDLLYNYLKLDLTLNYPDFENWYYNIVIPSLENDKREREVIIALSKVEGLKEPEITGIAILKKTENEKKICTFRVHEGYRSLGIGTQLFEECFKYLGTRKPIITISEDREPMFRKHIETYKFKCVESIPNLYRVGVKEYIYNGKLR